MICNFTMAFFSVSPGYMSEVKDGEVYFNERVWERMAEWFKGDWRIIPVHLGELMYINKKTLQDKGIEVMPIVERAEGSIDKITPEIGQFGVAMLSLASDEYEKSNDITNLWDWKLWTLGMLVVMALMALKVVFYSFKPLKKNHKRSFVWSTVEIFLLQKFPTNEIRLNRIITLTLALFIFLLLAILNSLISTDLIVKEKPFVIDTLEDILDPRASQHRPVWRKNGHLHTIFSKSTSPTKQRIWERALKIGLTKCLIEDDPNEMANLLTSYSNSPWVAFLFQDAALIMRSHMCFMPSLPGAHSKIHIGKEIVAQEHVRLSLNLKNDSCKPYKRSLIDRRVRVAFEAAISSRVTIDGIMKTTMNVHEDPLKKWKCMGLIDLFDTHEWLSIRMSNIQILLTFYSSCLILSTLVLCGEIIFSNISKRQKKSSTMSR